jgi:AcrR family transcriptional regulator
VKLSEPDSRPTAGLRERKKARTRAAIQAHALRLFRERGYDGTTVQQIIDAADISESTFFRYFPTKGDVVLLDDFDPLIVDSFLGQPAELNPIQALRASFRTVFSAMSTQEMSEQMERTQLIVAVPELRAAMMDQLASAMRVLAEALAERTGRTASDMAVRASPVPSSGLRSRFSSSCSTIRLPTLSHCSTRRWGNSKPGSSSESLAVTVSRSTGFVVRRVRGPDHRPR